MLFVCGCYQDNSDVFQDNEINLFLKRGMYGWSDNFTSVNIIKKPVIQILPLEIIGFYENYYKKNNIPYERCFAHLFKLDTLNTNQMKGVLKQITVKKPSFCDKKCVKKKQKKNDYYFTLLQKLFLSIRIMHFQGLIFIFIIKIK